MSGVSIHIQGAVEAARDYYARSQRAKDVRPAMDRVIDFWLGAEQRQFDSEAGWPPIKAKSREWKMRYGLDPRTMRASGLLEAVLTQRGMEGSGQYTEPMGDGLTVGLMPGRTQVYYAQTLVKKWPLVVFDDLAAGEATDLLGRWLEEGQTR